MSIICPHKGINGIHLAPFKPGGLVDRVGGPDCFKLICTLLPLSEHINLVVSRKDRTAWKYSIIYLDLTGKNIQLTKIRELLDLPNIKKIIIPVPVTNPPFPTFHLVPADHPTLQSLALKIANIQAISSLESYNETVLTHLELSESEIVLDQDLEGFARFIRLEQLILKHCNVMMVEGHLLGQIGSLSSLRDLRLNFSTQEIPDDDFSCLSGLSRLETLALTRCKIAEIGCATLGTLPNLKTLVFHECKLVTDAALRSLSNNFSLQVLILSGKSRSSHPDLASLAKLHQLETLELPNGSKITDAEMQELEKLSHLTSLTLLHSTQMTDTGVRSLAKLSHLKALDLSSSAITDEGLNILSEIPTLESIKLLYCNQITNLGLGYLSTLPHLRNLDVSFCDNMPHSAPDMFPEYRRPFRLPAVTIKR